MSSKCIVIVDMQNDFIDGALGTDEAQEMLPKLVNKLGTVRGVDLIFTQDTHHKDYLSTQEGKNLPVEHCIEGEKGWEICSALQPYLDKAKAVIKKPAFGSMELPSLVKEYDEVELVGLCTDICVISNAMILKAASPEQKIAVDASCCAGVTPESHEGALKAMKMCQIEIRNSSI
ncbi:isochorismatase family cysteine hydrolase [Anaerovibrio lipolyticus]|uniref:cysteine hydrolase family protein n=1 Tax=Anaerovibrio lipolyticus TaxID=82374 RepID=UPI0025F5205E|nr:isochorismatase family cysteine hydrolase [Anaerovibrio lipolyticus]